MSDMEYITYKMIEISKLNSGGDRPKIYSDTKTNECCFPIFSNGLQDEGLYGYTNKATMPSDTITVSARGANIGEVFYRKEDFLPIVRLITIIPDSNYVHSKYLYYYLKKVKIEGSGSAQPQITVPFFSRHKIVIPKDVEYQKKVAYILSTYDNLIENNNKRIKLLEQMAENLYKEWFVRFRFPGYENTEFENGIPKGWEVKKIKNCVKRLPFNQLYKRNELESEGKVIVIDQSSAEFLGYHNDEPSHCASIDKPVLLFGDHSCKFVLMIREFSLGENMVPFISGIENKLNNHYLFYAVHKIIVTEEYKRHWGRFTAMKILIPKYELQLAFADFIKPIIHEQNKLWNENQLLAKQRDMLLPRLMSGRLEV